MSTVAERVAAGAAFLDEHDPDWWKPDTGRAINVKQLDLAEPEQCVLGQRCPVAILAEYCLLDLAELSPDDVDELWSQEGYRAYTAYAQALSGFKDWAEIVVWADRHGFSNSAGWDGYPDLTAEWKRVITERRSAS